jgi:hypothetical protein
MDRDAAILLREERERFAVSRLLPKSVRLLRARKDGARSPAKGGKPADAMCEFEVVTGNAAYCKGEHFYLTPAQARRAYGSALSV